MYRPIRLFWNLAAIGGATAVGVITHDPGLIIITFLGGLVVPRLLGLSPRGPGWGAWGYGGCHGHDARARWRNERLNAWHREAHQEAPTQTPAASAPTQI
jgi:hypothetical protein